MANWKEYKLGEIAEIRNGKSRPKADGEIPVYGGNGILGYSNQFNVKDEIVVIGRVGAYCGSVYYEENPIWVSDNALYAKSNDGFDTKFLYYLLKNDNLNQYAGGSSHPLLTQGRLNDLIYKVPDLQIQSAIAEILSLLDDKIELNNKINQELEALAQALFKQWFIDFEFPDENGNPYKSAGGEMVESELGEIPKGWKVGKLKEICTISKINIKPFENPEIAYCHYSLPAFDEGQIPNIEFGETIKSSKYKVLPKAVLVSKLNPRFPRVWYIGKCNKHSICSTEFQVIVPMNETSFELVYSFCKSALFTDSLISKASGTSGSHQRVRPEDMLNIEFALPNAEIQNLFKLISEESFQLIEQYRIESENLKKLRETLLPKLISGELEVKEVESLIQ